MSVCHCGKPVSGDMTCPECGSYSSDEAAQKDGTGKKRNKENTVDTKGGDATGLGGKSM